MSSSSFGATTLRRGLRASCVVLVVLSALAIPRRGWADDAAADEAELHFQIGAEAYQKQDFRKALEHFLFSNRLAFNRKVTENIARCYTRLDQFAEAFRFYSLALDGETNPDTRASLEREIAALAPKVAVVRINTVPAGATLYIDRKDLGTRGTSPRALAFSGGKIRVIAELPGHESAVSDEIVLSAGASVDVQLSLKRILGNVSIDLPAQVNEISLTVDNEAARVVASRAPIDLPPGRHSLAFQVAGFEPEVHVVDVVASTSVEVKPRLQPLSGSLSVSTDERDAEIEVDGKHLGFTPSVVSVPVGIHTVRVTLAGFKPSVHVVSVREADTTRLDLDLLKIEEVSAASRSTESIDDAPSSVSIISATELRAMGYPTVIEALRGVRGLFGSDNRAYASVGMRGLSILGDYGQRVLVLLDGHPTNDNYIGSSYTGFDGRVDIDDLERIEVIRGPGSVLYGTGAFVGVINLVTRVGRRDRPSFEVGASAVGYGVARGRVRADYPFRDGGAWVSIAAAHGEGRSFTFPELATPTTTTSPATTGQSSGADGFRAGTANARLWYKSFNVQAFYTSRDKALPTGMFSTQLGDDRTRLRDSRGFVEARIEPTISSKLQVLGRAYYNTYSYRGAYSRARSDGGLGIDTFQGDWLGAEVRSIFTPVAPVKITVGGEAQHHLRAAQTSSDEDGSYLDRNDTFDVAAGYVLADITPSRRLRISGGTRLDYYSTFQGTSLNPRLAIIITPYERGTLKVLGGKAFRAPSVYELHYNDGGLTQVASPYLTPETIYSGEVELTHRFTSTTTAQLSGYTNLVKSLIVSTGAGDSTDPLRFVNSPADLFIVGAEGEIRREWRQGWMASAVYGVQRASYLGDQSTLRRVPNSPVHLGSVKGAAPILGRALTLMSRLSLESGRYDRFNERGVDRQTHTDPSAIWDVVLSGEEARLNLRYALGVYNAFDWRQRVPVSADFTQRTLIQNGRTFLLSGAISF